MPQNDKNEVDELFGKSSEGSSDDNGGKGSSTQDTPEIVEANGRKYDLSKADDRQAMANDYKNLNEAHSKQSNELGDLRKKQDQFSQIMNPDAKKETTEETQTGITDDDVAKLRERGVLTKQDLENQRYDESKTASVNQFAQKYGLTVADVLKEVDETIKSTGVKIDPNQIENWYAASHPKEYREARSKMIRDSHPGNHFTETIRKEGMELPSEEVPQFGKNVVDLSLELLSANQVD